MRVFQSVQKAGKGSYIELIMIIIINDFYIVLNLEALSALQINTFF